MTPNNIINGTIIFNERIIFMKYYENGWISLFLILQAADLQSVNCIRMFVVCYFSQTFIWIFIFFILIFVSFVLSSIGPVISNRPFKLRATSFQLYFWARLKNLCLVTASDKLLKYFIILFLFSFNMPQKSKLFIYLFINLSKI